MTQNPILELENWKIPVTEEAICDNKRKFLSGVGVSILFGSAMA